MRVATRRLRAVLEIYAPCFPRDEFSVVLRDVKALADALGARRDPDVQLAALAGMEERARPRRPRRAWRPSRTACAPTRRAATRCSPRRWRKRGEDDLEGRLRALVAPAAPSAGAAAA